MLVLDGPEVKIFESDGSNHDLVQIATGDPSFTWHAATII